MLTPLTKDFLVTMFSQSLGKPTKAVKKIVGWSLRPNLDLVIQLDSRQAADQVYVWISATERGITTIDCPCDLYAAGKSRHHGVARFPSLAADRWAIRFRPRTTDHIASILKIMIERAAKRGRAGAETPTVRR